MFTLKMYTRSFSNFTMFTTYLSFLLILAIGYMRDLVKNVLKLRNPKERPILTDFQSFYSRNCLMRILDCFSFPVHGKPNRIINIKKRVRDKKTGSLILTDEIIPLINFGSYNYLGFAETPPEILEKLISAIDRYPINFAACTRDIGRHDIIESLEHEMANFLYQEDCIVFPMGYGTNTSNIPCLLDEGTLIYSDTLNHASIITGLKMGRSTVKTFRHNDMDDLEDRLIYDISQGQNITHRSWKKIIVIVEGIYSMEGTILKLDKLIKLKKKYKFYIFIDEAHSIGALGKTGRGICEFSGINFKDVDILMGTFTKSFAGMGGYIAGSKKLVAHLRMYSDFSKFGDQMTPLVATQILESLRIIMNSQLGQSKLERLRRNTKLMRDGLRKLGLFVLGDEASPVIPIVISNPGKLCEISRLCREEGIGIVIVGYPGAPILYGRVRLCMSSAHTTEDIKKTLDILETASEMLALKM